MQTVTIEGGGVTPSLVHQPSNLTDWPYAAARTRCGTVQRSGGAGKLENMIEGLAFEKGEGKGAMEDVAGSGGVYDLDAEARALMK